MSQTSYVEAIGQIDPWLVAGMAVVLLVGMAALLLKAGVPWQGVVLQMAALAVMPLAALSAMVFLLVLLASMVVLLFTFPSPEVIEMVVQATVISGFAAVLFGALGNGFRAAAAEYAPQGNGTVEGVRGDQ